MQMQIEQKKREQAAALRARRLDQMSALGQTPQGPVQQGQAPMHQIGMQDIQQGMLRGGDFAGANAVGKFVPKAVEPNYPPEYIAYLDSVHGKPSPENFASWQAYKSSRSPSSAQPPKDHYWIDPLDHSKGVKVLKGSETARKIKAAEDQSRMSQENRVGIAQTVFEDLDRGLKVLDEYGGAATGVAGMVSDWMPPTPAGRLKAQLDSVKSNIGIDKLIAIKKEGSGLGQVPQSQLEMLASVLGKMDTNMQGEDLRYNMLRAQEIYADIVAKNGGKDPVKEYEARKTRLGGTESNASDPLGLR